MYCDKRSFCGHRWASPSAVQRSILGPPCNSYAFFFLASPTAAFSEAGLFSPIQNDASFWLPRFFAKKNSPSFCHQLCQSSARKSILSFPDIGDVRLFALSLLEEALQLPQVQRLAQEQLLGRRSAILCSVFDARSLAAETGAEGGAAWVARPELFGEDGCGWKQPRFQFHYQSQKFTSDNKNPEIPRAAIFFPRFGYVPTFEELSNAPWMPNPGWLISSWEDATSARSRAVGMPLSNPCVPGLSSTPQTRRRRDRRGMTMLCVTAQCASWPLGLLNVLSWHCREAKDEEADRTIARPQMAWQNGRVKWMNRGP